MLHMLITISYSVRDPSFSLIRNILFYKKILQRENCKLNSNQCSMSIPSEYIRKPLLFWGLQVMWTWNIGLKSIKSSPRNLHHLKKSVITEKLYEW